MESRSLDEQLGPDAIAELEANEAADPAARLAAGRIGALLPDALDLFDARRDGRDRPVPVPWPSVEDALGGGLWAGMHVLTGGTGAGKSQWALQVSLEAATSGVPVLYVGLELDAPGIVARLIGMLAKVRDGKGLPWSALYTGRDRDHNGKPRQHDLMGRAAELADELRGLPIHCVFGGPMGFAPDELRALGDALRAEHPEGPALVVFDFLQLVGDPEGERLELRERIGRAAYQGRAMARELALSVVMVSSVAREHYGKIGGLAKKGDKKGDAELVLGEAPAALLVGLGKESGEIEYAADSVLCLAAGEDDDDQRGRPVWLAVAKLRAGPAGWCGLRFNGQTFADDPRRADDARRLARMPKASEPKASRAKDRLK